MIFVIKEKDVGLVDDEAPQLAEVDGLASTEERLELAVRRHHYLRRLAVVHRVAQGYPRVCGKFLIDSGYLVAKLTDIDDADDLNGLQVAVDAQSRPNGEGASFT